MIVQNGSAARNRNYGIERSPGPPSEQSNRAETVPLVVEHRQIKPQTWNAPVGYFKRARRRSSVLTRALMRRCIAECCPSTKSITAATAKVIKTITIAYTPLLKRLCHRRGKKRAGETAGPAESETGWFGGESPASITVALGGSRNRMFRIAPGDRMSIFCLEYS